MDDAGFRDGRDAPNNPNHCPVCGSRDDTGVKFGFNPTRVTPTERIVHDVTHGCLDCDATWTAWGHHLIVPNSLDDLDGFEPSDEGRAALLAAIEASGELRIEIHPPDEDEGATGDAPAE